MPLTTITAWEALYDRLSLHQDAVRGKTITTSNPTTPTDVLYISNNKRNEHKSYILIIGGAGGVGSIAIQLQKI